MIDPSLKSIAKNIKLVLLDVDGVLTDGSIFIHETGEIIKCFSSIDGQGIKMIHQAGLQSGIISGRSSKAIITRASELGIQYVYLNAENKIIYLQEIMNKTKFNKSEIAYLGDDLPDIPIIRQVGFGCAVNNAHQFVKENSLAVTSNNGGKGAVREFCDFILSSKNLLSPLMNNYLAMHESN